MIHRNLLSGMVALVAGLALAACGGGSSSFTTSTSVGVITGFGSIYVNGCEYETGSARISVEGSSGTEDDLSAGDVVEITGPINCLQASASSVKYADEVEGVVDSNSVTGGNGTMVVMGQDVTVNDLTIYEDYTGSVPTVNNVASGHVVEVNGYSIGTGQIVATRIEVKAETLADYGDEIEVKGVVMSHNPLPTSDFKIGNLTVNYGSAILDDISVITDGLYVEVKATDYTAGSMMVNATKVEREDDGKIGYHGDDDEELEIKGMLTAAYDADTRTFGINDQMVLVNDNTEFDDLRISDLNSSNLGKLYMEVEGHFNTEGVLVAYEVELEDDDVNDSSEIYGFVSNLVSTGDNTGTLTVSSLNLSVNLTVTNNSIMYDSEGPDPESKFNFSHLRNTDYVEVYYDATTNVIIKLEREDPVS